MKLILILILQAEVLQKNAELYQRGEKVESLIRGVL
jgi:hypothetical protein